MTDTNISNFDPALKQIYRDSNVEKLVYTNRPALGLFTKFTGFGGRNMPVVIVYGNPMGRSANIYYASTGATAVAVEDFLLTRVSDYSVAYITSETIEATRGDNMAFLQALKTKIDGAMNALSDSLESALFRDGYGYIGKVGAAPSVANPMVLTLDQVEESTNFEVGMILTAYTGADGATGNHATPATVTVVKINRSAGTITTAYNNGGSGTNWANADYLYVYGDEAAKLKGLQAWLPTTIGASDSFFTVNRSYDSRLWGVAHDASADTIEDGFIDGQSKVGREGGSPDIGLVHHSQFRKFIKELGAKKVYNQVMGSSTKGGDARVGYRGVTIDGDEGAINIIAANKCPVTTGFALTKESWTLATLGEPVKFLSEDGNRILRTAIGASDTDARYEVRVVFRGNLGCKAPIWNARITLASP
jgi:hypothetical protein